MVLRQDVQDKVIQMINKTIINTNTDKIVLYGGATSQTLHDRLDQHKNEDVRFENMKSILLHETDSYEVIKDAEKFLIEQLSILNNNNPKYEILNDKNMDGQLAQRGGAGIREGENNYRLYLLVNNKKYNFMENIYEYNPFNLFR